MQTHSKSTLSLENQQTMTVTGIKRIRTTEPHQIVASLDNCTIIIGGKNLTVQNVSVKEGVLELTGLVESIRYASVHSKRWSFKNLFR